ncbi:hypothetical protein FQA47_012391 [Oryzias melastigma]|uniref:Uncharacterized protein n=1 Tax=Oryzias melastigma TaxID=30732 RepID=A0A834L043_ORYME|nr:hypothetical protein FQA47_012391 [Oryzias melastigma]
MARAFLAPKTRMRGGKYQGAQGVDTATSPRRATQQLESLQFREHQQQQSTQDICSSGQLISLQEDASESNRLNKNRKTTSAMTVTSTALSSAAQGQKRPTKRRHRRKRSSCTTLDCVEANSKQEQSDRSLSSDRSELGEKRERSFRNRRELPPRLRCSGAQESDSSSEDETCRETRSWSKEKARRARRRSVSSREREAANGHKEDKAETMELQSVDSDEGKENQPLVESDGLKKRHSIMGSVKRDAHVSQKERSRSKENEKSRKSRSPRGSSSLGEGGEELITKKYQERGSGDGDMSVPTPQKHCGVNGGMPRPCSEDSELEVCRICHCEGDDEFPADHAMPLHGEPELRPSGLSQPVDQILRHPLLRTLQV